MGEEPSASRVRDALIEAGLEIYEMNEDRLRIAERIRLHLMDSGVSVHVGDNLAVSFTIRAQLSDAPFSKSEELFERARAHMKSHATQRGFREQSSKIVEIKDPMDASRVLDVWHELTFAKTHAEVAQAIADIHWALELERCVPRRG